MKIKELLTDKSKWCQGNFAMDKNDGTSYAVSPNACRWCLVGALYKCYGFADDACDILNMIEDELKVCNSFEDVIVWNDYEERTFEDVKALVEKLDI